MMVLFKIFKMLIPDHTFSPLRNRFYMVRPPVCLHLQHLHTILKLTLTSTFHLPRAHKISESQSCCVYTVYFLLPTHTHVYIIHIIPIYNFGLISFRNSVVGVLARCISLHTCIYKYVSIYAAYIYSLHFSIDSYMHTWAGL